MLFPNADVVPSLQTLASSSDRALLLVNPQWQAGQVREGEGHPWGAVGVPLGQLWRGPGVALSAAWSGSGRIGLNFSWIPELPYTPRGSVDADLQVVSDFGFGAKKRDSEEFLKSFVVTYSLKSSRVRGSDVTIVRSYPSEW